MAHKLVHEPASPFATSRDLESSLAFALTTRLAFALTARLAFALATACSFATTLRPGTVWFEGGFQPSGVIKNGMMCHSASNDLLILRSNHQNIIER